MKTKDLSSRLGLSDNGVRFLEQEGFVSPSRDSRTGYREFSNDDFCLVAMYQLYRRLAMSPSQIREAMAAPPDHTAELLDERVAEMRRELEQAEAAVDAAKRLLLAAAQGPTAEIAVRPHLHVFYPDDPSVVPADVLAPWLSSVPESFFGILYRRSATGYEALRARVAEHGAYRRAGLSTSPYEVEYAELEGCLRFVTAYEGDSGSDDLETLGRALAECARMGVVCGGDVVARFLYLQSAGAGSARYTVELWLPLRQPQGSP